jgi:DNA primase
LLWQRETENQVFDSPERRAALDNRLRSALAKIADQNLRAHYAEEMRRLRQALFRAPRDPQRLRGAPYTGRNAPPAPAHSVTRSTRLASADGDHVAEQMREEIVLATLLAHPDLLRQFEADLDRAEMRVTAGRPLARGAAGARGADRSGGQRCRRIARAAPCPASRPRCGTAQTQTLRAAVWKKSLPNSLPGAAWMLELREATEDLADLADEGLTWRLRQAADAAQQFRTLAPVMIKRRSGRRSHRACQTRCNSLIESEVWIKRKK